MTQPNSPPFICDIQLYDDDDDDDDYDDDDDDDYPTLLLSSVTFN